MYEIITFAIINDTVSRIYMDGEEIPVSEYPAGSTGTFEHDTYANKALCYMSSNDIQYDDVRIYMGALTDSDAYYLYSLQEND